MIPETAVATLATPLLSFAPLVRHLVDMSKALIIAEKPSVAADIARALGGFTRNGDYFESDDYVISSAVGHLLEIAAPEQFEVKRGKWSFAHLAGHPAALRHPPDREEPGAAEAAHQAASSARTSTS